jgi:AMP nucleosidase
MRDRFDLLTLTSWTTARQWNGQPGLPRPIALFNAPRAITFAAPPASLYRQAAEHFQNFVLFTNYQFYIDVRRPGTLMTEPDPRR